MQISESIDDSPHNMSPQHQNTEILLDTSQEMIGGSISDSSSMLQKYHVEFKSKLSKAFEDEHSQNRELDFQQLIRFIDLIGKEVRDEPQLYEILNIGFIKRLVKYCSSSNPLQIKQAILLIDSIMKQKILANRMVHQRGCERILIDLINSLINLQLQFKHTFLEQLIDKIINSISVSNPQNNSQAIEKEHVATIRTGLKKMQENHSSNNFMKELQTSLTSCETMNEQYQLFSGQIQELIVEFLLIVKQDDEVKQISNLSQILAIYERYIFDVQYSIYMDLHNLREQKNYYLKNEKQLICSYFSRMYKGCASLLNMILVLPAELGLQKRVFNIIKILYKYIPSLRSQLIGPITLVLRNLSLFLPKDTLEFKSATIFLYQIINQSDYDEKVRQNWSEDEDLCFLRENKYYSVKALSYIDESEVVQNLRNLTISVLFPCYSIISAASIYNYSVFVEKPNSILYWSFRTLDYDVQFGLFKLNQVEELGISDYVEEKNGVKCLIKLQRVDSHKQPGVTLITNPGFYRIIFDNSYSYLRSKQLFYTIHLLEIK